MLIPWDIPDWHLSTSSGNLHPLGHLVRPLFAPFEPTSALKEYQKDGVAWLAEHDRCILADDMGLGKTLQVLEAARTLIYRGSTRAVLVIAPRTLVSNWERELERWAGDLSVASSVKWEGDDVSLAALAVSSRVHVLIVHYEWLRSSAAARLQGAAVDLMVLDEAHRVRRSDSQTTAAVRAIGASRIWATTGTPIERDAEDLATLLSIVSPSRYSASLHRLSTDALRSLATGSVLRRRKDEVLRDLPPVREYLHEVPLTREQQVSYGTVLNRLRSGTTSGGALLSGLAELLDICDADPITGASSKLADIVAQVTELADSGKKAVVFSYKLRPLDLLAVSLAGVAGFSRIDGRMTVDERSEALEAFLADPSVMVLLASSRVAGEGLTLTAASSCFFVNRWWNPSSNDQARDRLVRIGQTSDVESHSYVCTDTIEERLQVILDSKHELVDSLVNQLATPTQWHGRVAELKDVLGIP